MMSMSHFGKTDGLFDFVGINTPPYKTERIVYKYIVNDEFSIVNTFFSKK